MVRGNYFVNNLPTWRSHHVAGFPLLPCAFGQEAHAHIYDAVAEDFSRLQARWEQCGDGTTGQSEERTPLHVGVEAIRAGCGRGRGD